MKVNYEITTYCNAKCPTCARTIRPPELKHADTFISLGTIQKFCGERGDALMHPNIEKFFDQCSNIEVHTNGGIRKSSWYRRMMKTYPIKFHFGIDGIGEDKYRIGVDNAKAIHNMKETSKEGLTVWEFTLFSWNLKMIPEAIRITWENKNLKLLLRENRDRDEVLPYDEIERTFNENKIEEDYPWPYKTPKVILDVP